MLGKTTRGRLGCIALLWLAAKEPKFPRCLDTASSRVDRKSRSMNVFRWLIDGLLM